MRKRTRCPAVLGAEDANRERLAVGCVPGTSKQNGANSSKFRIDGPSVSPENAFSNTYQTVRIQGSSDDHVVRWVARLDVKVAEKHAWYVTTGESIKGFHNESGVNYHHVKIKEKARHVVHANDKLLTTIEGSQASKNRTVPSRSYILPRFFAVTSRSCGDETRLCPHKAKCGFINWTERQHVDKAQEQALCARFKRFLSGLSCNFFFLGFRTVEALDAAGRNFDVHILEAVDFGWECEGDTHESIEGVSVESWNEFVPVFLKEQGKNACPRQGNLLQANNSAGPRTAALTRKNQTQTKLQKAKNSKTYGMNDANFDKPRTAYAAGAFEESFPGALRLPVLLAATSRSGTAMPSRG